MPVDFIVLDIDCNPSCPIILGRPFLRMVGAIIDMKEGNIRFQFPLKKGMEQFPRKKVKLPYESIMRATYECHRKEILFFLFKFQRWHYLDLSSLLCLARGVKRQR